MASSRTMSSTRREEATGEDEEEDPLLTFRHVRSASVILPSGDRVRRKVSLLSICDESPFEDEQSPLLGNGISNTPGGYSSVHLSPSNRDLPSWHKSRLDRIKDALRSEALKRCNPVFRSLTSEF